MSELPAETDVLVVGAGPGGYVSAIRAAQLGLSVTLVDADKPGGTCLNYGCIPSKALLSAASIVHEAGHHESMGIYADPYVDWDELLEWESGVVDQLTGGVEHLCDAAGVTLVTGRAQFVNDTEADVELPDGDHQRISFEKVVIATGSRPIRLPSFPFEEDRVLVSRDVFSLEKIQNELLVVGGGYIGLELATLFAKLGTSVTVLEGEDNVLPGWEDDLRSTVRDHVSSLGVEFVFEEFATDCTVTPDAVEVTTTDAADRETTHAADRVVVAVGREPVTDTAGLDRLGLEFEDSPFIETDDQCGAVGADDHVFAVGDVAGEPMLAHKASAEGIVAAETIAGQDASMADRVVPAVVFTDPEVGTVGLSKTEAEDAGHEIAVGRMPFSASGRALAAGNTKGYVQVIVDQPSGELLGGRVVGKHASELVGELALAVQSRTTADEVADTIHAHPTLSESVMEACAAAVEKAIHVAE
ncbi:dihydrolipoyl dehydrogenase [Halorubrum sp. DTA46]|uniref:dihydrolipoyl dehydrogenase n=1 Tax=Halorubrum sp. DTA46 TaxID=3402162 RepID=UPI003AABBB06